MATTCAAFAQAPAVSPGGIVNHFSYATLGLPNAGIAQGSIFDIYGSNIGPAELTQLAGFPIPTVIANTSVQVTSGGTTVDVYLFFVSSGQIVGVLPSRTPAGDGTLTVTVNGQRSEPAPIRVVARSIGILSLNQAGHGPAVMQMSDGLGGAPLNSVAAAIQPLGVGVFYGTGGGAVTFDETVGAPAGDLGPEIHALVDGKEARLLYKGRAPGFAGLDQFNVEIPAGISGCYVAVAFRTGNVISNYTTISVADSGACPDPKQPPQTTGTLSTGTVTLDRSDLKRIEFTSDNASALFSVTDFSKVTPVPEVFSAQIGACTVRVFPQAPRPFNRDAVSYLDAGPFLTLRGPNGDKVLAQYQDSGTLTYGAAQGSTPFPGLPPVGPLYLSPGAYTVNNGAGAQVGPFEASLTIPEFVWTNQDITSVERAQGQEFTWTGGDPNSLVSIDGISSLPESATQPKATGRIFNCSVPSAPGRFTVPAEVLLALPPTIFQGGFPTGGLIVSITNTATFNATGLDSGIFSYRTGISRDVEFK